MNGEGGVMKSGDRVQVRDLKGYDWNGSVISGEGLTVTIAFDAAVGVRQPVAMCGAAIDLGGQVLTCNLPLGHETLHSHPSRLGPVEWSQSWVDRDRTFVLRVCCGAATNLSADGVIVCELQLGHAGAHQAPGADTDQWVYW